MLIEIVLIETFLILTELKLLAEISDPESRLLSKFSNSLLSL